MLKFCVEHFSSFWPDGPSTGPAVDSPAGHLCRLPGPTTPRPRVPRMLPLRAHSRVPPQAPRWAQRAAVRGCVPPGGQSPPSTSQVPRRRGLAPLPQFGASQKGQATNPPACKPPCWSLFHENSNLRPLEATGTTHNSNCAQPVPTGPHGPHVQLWECQATRFPLLHSRRREAYR